MTGRIFNIQRFSLHDGPGIRTTVFLMGCPLRCKWCHNPEGFSEAFSLQYFDRNCIGCGNCVAMCPQGVHRLTDNTHIVRFDRCVLCGSCLKSCPSGALSQNGREYTSEELVVFIRRDHDYYGREGGVTFSGGEPLLQANFIEETCRLLKNGKAVSSTAVDTSGYVPWEAFEKTLPIIDTYLFDIKAVTEELHLIGTGKPNRLILANLEKLDQSGKKIRIRIPVIPCFNDTLQEMNKIYRIVKKLHHVVDVRLIPYHIFGQEKYITLGLQREQPVGEVEDEKMKLFRKMFENNYFE